MPHKGPGRGERMKTTLDKRKKVKAKRKKKAPAAMTYK